MQPFPDFSPALSFAQSVRSDTAIRKGIINQPNAEQYANMKRVFEHIYVPLCQHYGLTLPVSSFFRCPALNRAIGGAKNSQHMYGQAIDIDCDSLAVPTNKELFAYIRSSGLGFDQIITEFPDANGKPGWIHVSFVSEKINRNNALQAISRNGKTEYVTL